jgi:phage terminase large subunit-like protein
LRNDGTKPKPDWSPKYFTPALSALSDGDDLIAFAENYCTVTKGFQAGEPLTFTDWQAWLLRRIYERTDDGRLRYRRVYVELPRKNGKSLLGSTIAL